VVVALKIAEFAMKPRLKKLIFVIIIIFTGIYVCKQNRPNAVINSDGDGYYIYLPAFIIFKDYNFTHKNTFSDAYNKRIEQSYFARESEGKKIDQFTCGVAVLWLPFFLSAHFIAKMFSVPDGYSEVYQMAVALAAFVYLVLGLLFLVKLFHTYRLSKLTKWVVAMVILLGTNLFHYAFFEPSMSHVYSFSVITVFLFTVRSYFVSGRIKYLWTSLLLLALVVLIRPFNVFMLLLVPFLADDFAQCRTTFRNMFLKHYAWLLAGLFMFVAVVYIQSVIWFVQTGYWLVDSYKNQGFHFAEPHVWNVLFGFRKGLFVYTPVLLFALPGLFVLFKQNRFRFFVILLFLAVLVYAVSCWWNWWYGMSYGHRAFVDYYAVFALLMALFYEKLVSKPAKYAVSLLLLVGVMLNQVQAFQYRNYILHWDQMTAKKYIAVFGQTSAAHHTDLWSAIRNEKKMMVGNRTCFTSENDLENNYEHWDNSSSFVSSTCGLPSGELCVKTDGYFTMTPLYSRNLKDVSAGSPAKVVICYKAYYKNKPDAAKPDITFYVELDSAQITLQKFQSPALLSGNDAGWNLISGTAELELKNPIGKTLKACFVANDGCPRYYDDFFSVVYCKPIGD
jgi:hypothetical protein